MDLMPENVSLSAVDTKGKPVLTALRYVYNESLG